MQGQRKDVEPHEMQPGDYGRPYGSWYCMTPSGQAGNLRAHDVIEHDDGTITVSPSILVSTRQDGREVELWHGYLEHGIWRQV